MKKVFFGLLVILIFGANPINAQDYTGIEPLHMTRGLYAGGQAATSGLGLNLRYVLSKHITLKSGYETLNFNRNFDFDENDITYDASLNYKTGGVFAMVDIFYSKALYISAGASVNQLNPQITGEAVSALQYGDISIPASEIGDFHFEMEPSIKISPYGGIGFRQFFGTQKRVVYNFETGLYYLGEPKVEIDATGLLSPTADPAHGQKELFEEQLSAYKFYPVVKMNIAVKLF